MREVWGVKLDSDRLFGVTCKNLGMLAVALAGLVGCGLYLMGRSRSWLGLATLHLLACFLFLTGLSERFLVFGAASAAAWAVFDSRVRNPSVLLCGLLVVNLLHNTFYQPTSRWAGLVPAGAANGIALTAVGLTVASWMWLAVVYLQLGSKRNITLW